MAIFLVDLEFREKARQMLTSREILAVILFLMFALVPWVQVAELARGVANSTAWLDGEAAPQNTHCNPHTRACL